MLRIGVPSGVLSAGQLRRLAAVQRRYGDGLGHFTTRQSVQIHPSSLSAIPGLFDELAEAGLDTLQTSGPSVRSITLDPLAGAALDEIDDPRPWAELLRRWATLNPALSPLPHKLKIALSAGQADRAAVRVHDVGLRLVSGAQEDSTFEIWVGGGLGRRPMAGQRLYEAVPGSELLLYLEALLRVYARYGQHVRRDRARLRHFVARLGLAPLREAVDTELCTLDGEALRIGPVRYRAAAAQMPASQPAAPAGDESLLARQAELEPAFAEWLAWNTEPQRQGGLRAVTVCLKGEKRAPGTAHSEELERLAGLAEQINGGELRCTQQQDLLLPHVPLASLYEAWRALDTLGLAKPLAGTLADAVACPGAPICELAQADTAGVVQAVQRHLAAHSAYTARVGRLAVSGCMNACSHHPTADIGIRGVHKRGASWYQLQLGGSAAVDEPRFGRPLGPALPREQVPGAVAALIDQYLALRRHASEPLAHTLERVGRQPFQAALPAPLAEGDSER